MTVRMGPRVDLLGDVCDFCANAAAGLAAELQKIKSECDDKATWDTASAALARHQAAVAGGAK